MQYICLSLMFKSYKCTLCLSLMFKSYKHCPAKVQSSWYIVHGQKFSYNSKFYLMVLNHNNKSLEKTNEHIIHIILHNKYLWEVGTLLTIK